MITLQMVLSGQNNFYYIKMIHDWAVIQYYEYGTNLKLHKIYI